jgi:hypothetical protein
MAALAIPGAVAGFRRRSGLLRPALLALALTALILLAALARPDVGQPASSPAGPDEPGWPLLFPTRLLGPIGCSDGIFGDLNGDAFLTESFGEFLALCSEE